MLKLNKKTMRTQKERLDKGRKIFNDKLVEYSVSDNIYEAISEWRFIYKVDCYSYDGDEKFIKELLKNASNSDRFDKMEINYYEDGYGCCICGQNNLRYVYYIPLYDIFLSELTFHKIILDICTLCAIIIYITHIERND